MLEDCTYEDGGCTKCGHHEGDPPSVMRDERPVVHIKLSSFTLSTACGLGTVWVPTVVLGAKPHAGHRLCKNCKQQVYLLARKSGVFDGRPRQCE